MTSRRCSSQEQNIQLKMSIICLILIFLLLLVGNIESLPLDDTVQALLQHNIDELKHTVAGLTQEVEKLKHPKVVAFLAELSGSYFTPTNRQTLIYSQVHLNTGNGYNEYRGIFYAPVSGIYYINVAITVSESNGNAMHIKIKRNGDEVGFLFFESPTSQWLKNRDAIIIHLNANDAVLTEVTLLRGGPQIATSKIMNMYSYFSGFLINQD